MAQPTSSSSSTTAGPGQPIPRMTDSMAPSQAGPGPSSFKLAALSAQSFHLDSPPFTGTAGPLSDPLNSITEGRAEGQTQYETSGNGGHASSSGQLPSNATRSTSVDAAHVRSPGGGRRTVDRTEAGGGSGVRSADTYCGTTEGQSSTGRDTSLPPSRRQQTDGANATTGSRAASVARSNNRSDVDVPPWSLDDEARRHRYRGGANSAPDGDTTLKTAAPTDGPDEDATPMFDAQMHFGHTQSTSLSPPPFSSAGPGPVGSTGSSSTRAELNAIAQARVPRRREQSRPTFTQTSHADSATSHLEDAASSAAGAGSGSDGDGNVSEDVDADIEQIQPPDGEVDGDDDRPYLVGRNGHANGGGGSGGGTADGGGSGTPKKMPLQSQTKEEYKFPRHRLPTRMRNESKIPLVIVACGSFSPPTYLHLRIFEMAKDQVIESGKYELLGGYYSPVSDYYKKEGLAKATHRVRMCELAVEKTSTWLMVDAWESLQDEYQRTAVVLDHFDEEINGGSEGGILTSDGSRRRIRVMLLAGGDLIQSMGEPGVWADADLHHILGRYGCMIVERTGADVWSFLLSHDLLWRYRKNLKIVKQTIFNDISSSKVRLFVRRGQSIKYLLPNSVIHYIEQRQLYRLPKELDTEPPDADLQHF